MKRFAGIVLIICMVLALAGCQGGNSAGTADSSAGSSSSDSSSDESATVQVFAMDTYMEMTAYGENAQAALDEIAEEIEALDALLSVTDEDSEVYALNNSGGEETAVSDVVISLILFTQTISEETGGALDITVYPVVRAWGFTTDDYSIPDDDEIEALLENVDESLIEVDTEAGTVILPDGMEMDLGSVVKGYACSIAEDILAEYGVEHALLNLGGSTISLVGTKTDGSSWRIAIQDPEDDSSYAGVLECSDVTIDTSGGYERYFTDDDGNVYWHIIDPETGCPADSGLISSTIVCSDSTAGDALSTACFVMGLEGTIDYWRTYGGFDFILITEDHEIYISEGIADNFTPLYDYEKAELTVVCEDE